MIHSTFEKIDAMAGIKIPRDRVQTILEGLGFVFESLSDEAFSVRVPSWRATKDISLPEDIAEEVIRIYGYEHIPTLPLYGDLHMGQKNTERYLKDRLLQYFAER